jgi:hypothetical protein
MRRHERAQLEHDLGVAAQRDPAEISAPFAAAHEAPYALVWSPPKARQSRTGQRLAPDVEELSEPQTDVGADLDHARRRPRPGGVGAAAGGDERPPAELGPGQADAGRDDYHAPACEELDVHAETWSPRSRAAKPCNGQPGCCSGAGRQRPVERADADGRRNWIGAERRSRTDRREECCRRGQLHSTPRHRSHRAKETGTSEHRQATERPGGGRSLPVNV